MNQSKVTYRDFTRTYSKITGSPAGFESYHLAARLLNHVERFDLRNAQMRCAGRTVSVRLEVPHDINSAVVTL